MKKIVLNNATINDFREAKKILKKGEVLFVIAKESYIATLKDDGGEYLNFSNELPSNHFRDIFLNANNTIGFVMRTSIENVMQDNANLSYIASNVWYTVLSEFLPLERVGTKIRTLDSLCVADFVSNVVGNENITIGYINVGTEFNMPNYDNLVINRDLKGKCDISKEHFEEIIDRVFNYLAELVEVEL